MNKKYLRLIVVLLGIVVFVDGCSSRSSDGRDLSTPSTRLVGHWEFVPDYELDSLDPCLEEIYISELDEESVGSYISVSPSGGGITTSSEECVISYGRYRVVTNEYPEWPESPELLEYGNPVVIRFIIEEVYDFPSDMGLLVSEYGQSLTVDYYGLAEFQYIDSKSEP